MTAAARLTAREVSESLLRITAKGLMERDFDTFAPAFHLPQVMTTESSKITVSTRAELARVFEETCNQLRSLGVSNLIRECEAAEFRGPNRVEATHISHVIAASRHVRPPYPVFSVIELIDGAWKIVSSDYALEDSSELGTALKAAGTITNDALSIYQEHLDVLSAALIDQDFDTFKARISLPHRITTETDIIVMDNEAEMETIFRSFARTYNSEQMTDFVRIAKEAHFVSDHEIIGIHISHQMRGDQRILAPYPNRVRLLRGPDGQWRETHCANAILNDSKNYRLWTRLAEQPRLPDLALDLERTPK